MGLPSALIRRVAIAAYEAEMNTVMYARRGTMTLHVTPAEVTIDVRDEGPGIPDIALAMQEGYSTATPEMREMGFGAGMGLPNIRRNTDEMRDHVRGEPGHRARDDGARELTPWPRRTTTRIRFDSQRLSRLHGLPAGVPDRGHPDPPRARHDARGPLHRLRRVHQGLHEERRRAADRVARRARPLRLHGRHPVARALHAVRSRRHAGHDPPGPAQQRLRRRGHPLVVVRRRDPRHRPVPRGIPGPGPAHLLVLPERRPPGPDQVPRTGRSAAAGAVAPGGRGPRGEAPGVGRDGAAARPHPRGLRDAVPREDGVDCRPPRHGGVVHRLGRRHQRPVPAARAGHPRSPDQRRERARDGDGGRPGLGVLASTCRARCPRKTRCRSGACPTCCASSTTSTRASCSATRSSSATPASRAA
ncbi:MAG: hypothetical protein MZV70_15835 [Desulfobacterales bacterium]|nr:hypothetical protein [Desulfobacterales bacterium]